MSTSPENVAQFLVTKLPSPNVRESKTVLDSGFHAVDSTFQLLDSSLCQWNLDSGFQSLVGFRIPGAVFRIAKPKIPDSSYGFQSLSAELGFWIQSLVGFWIPWAVFWVPKPTIPGSTSKIFLDSGIRIPSHGVISINIPFISCLIIVYYTCNFFRGLNKFPSETQTLFYLEMSHVSLHNWTRLFQSAFKLWKSCFLLPMTLLLPLRSISLLLSCLSIIAESSWCFVIASL